ncbi:MAG: deoxyguanosinetriphosphate triphosphohydrolase [Oscillospiraceae bacterium]|nr:deoxyguanosinetriphosphate triphosphohydrolase [Oscillospiraceae bacterium]MDD6084869.1 deoxyguanosinetriphosphate triphosphohydrolase [Oscillospiraceae bacterium]MDY3257537.1 deoxyguanosinetriphosphate triphosphohydrolase [Ruminococcus callidus]
MNFNEKIIEREKILLCDGAAKSNDVNLTKRNREEEPPTSFRTEFQRDRDRILHSNSFRRLKRKTQVFLSPVGDHYRTRLTHTLEVSQIARTIASAMDLNESLTEAIALGHDLGHSPFGHSGEAVLNEICIHGYKHYEQSLRVVDYIEKKGKGLNLTYAVRDGILKHTNMIADTLEGNIVRVADRIAYINHDIEDAVRAGILHNEELPAKAVEVLGKTKTQRITTLVNAVIENGTNEIGMNKTVKDAEDILYKFMFEAVYHNKIAKQEETKAQNLIEKLFNYFLSHNSSMPDEYKEIAVKYDTQRAVCDYISGMSDGYAVALYRDLFIPKAWESM